LAGGSGGILAGGAGGIADGGTSGSAGAMGTCPGNLLLNPGFENGLEGWKVLAETDGSRHEFGVQAEVRASGELALVIDTTKVIPASSTTYRLVVGSVPLTVRPGDAFEASGVVQAAGRDNGSPSIGIRFYDPSGRPVPDATALIEVRETTMTPIGPFAVTTPEQARSARVVFVSPNNAVLYADDFCLAW
jgi:hypothetical protein